MANTFFSFKQFTVQQSNCAMKVCTDACLFGAWTAQQIHLHLPSPRQVLDIGTGTGLLSLMLAQQIPTPITAVEIDEAAATQAKDNFSHSPWPHQLQIQVANIISFTSPTPFDWIVSNPPFYENDLPSVQPNRNTALHSSQLTLQQLLQAIHRLLSPEGFATLLLPYHRFNYFQELAANVSLHIHAHTQVHQTTRHGAFRSMVLISKMPAIQTTTNNITIKNGATYTSEFEQLLHPYYLYVPSNAPTATR